MSRSLVRSLFSALGVLFATSLAMAAPPPTAPQPGPSVSFGLLPISNAQSPNNMVDAQGRIISTSVGINAVWNGAPVGGATRSSSSFVSSPLPQQPFVFQTTTIGNLGAAGSTVQTANRPVGTVMYGTLQLKNAVGQVIAGPIGSPTYTVR